jgi:hypothetical protein
MKRKPLPPPDAVVPREILENAQNALKSDVSKLTAKCVVCSSPCAPNSTEGLCWVCRRLKISAWRESDQQMSAQE